MFTSTSERVDLLLTSIHGFSDESIQTNDDIVLIIVKECRRGDVGRVQGTGISDSGGSVVGGAIASPCSARSGRSGNNSNERGMPAASTR